MSITGPGIDEAQIRDVPAGEERGVSWNAIAEALFGTSAKLALPHVTPSTAMQLSAVWGCMQVLSNAFARVPAVVFRRTDAGRERATDHAVYTLLHDRPNPWMTPFQFRRTIEMNRLGFGRGVAVIRRENGVPSELWPVHGSRVNVAISESGQLVYQIRRSKGSPFEGATSGGGVYLTTVDLGDDSEVETLNSYDVLDFQGLSYDGVNCMSVISALKRVAQQGLAAEDSLTTFVAQGFKGGGTLKVPTKLTETGRATLEKSFNAQYSRPDFAGKVVVLEGGVEFAPLEMMTLADAEWIAQSKMRVEDIARFFGVPLHLIQSMDRATNNNIEHQSLDFLNHSLAPQLDNAAQEMTYKLLLKQERADHYVGHVTQAIMSVDARSRAEYYMRMHQMGVLNASMICDLEDVNRPGDGVGDVYYVPVNLAPAMNPAQAAKALEKATAPPPAPNPPPNADASGDDSNDKDADEEAAQ
jgi:HK97 family phage portal protein